MNPRNMIAECLRDGRRWVRSFQYFRTTLESMIEAGEVHRVAPENGTARNMVELTGRGWKVYFGENLLVTRLDNFAELLAMGFEPEDAGKELFLTKGQIRASMQEIAKHLGAQAA